MIVKAFQFKCTSNVHLSENKLNDSVCNLFSHYKDPMTQYKFLCSYNDTESNLFNEQSHKVQVICFLYLQKGILLIGFS